MITNLRMELFEALVSCQQPPPHHCVPGAGVLRGRVRLPARAVGGAGGPGVRHHLRQEVRLEEGGENINYTREHIVAGTLLNGNFAY